MDVTPKPLAPIETGTVRLASEPYLVNLHSSDVSVGLLLFSLLARDDLPAAFYRLFSFKKNEGIYLRSFFSAF